MSSLEADADDFAYEQPVEPRALTPASPRELKRLIKDWRSGRATRIGDERLLVVAGGGEVLADVHALGLEAHGEVLDPVLHLHVHQGLGHLVLDQLGEGLAGLLLDGHLRLDLLHHPEPLGRVGPQLVDGGELGGLLGPGVVGVGELLLG